MEFRDTELEGVVEVSLQPHVDDRGWFARALCDDEFGEAGLTTHWVQVNQGYSTHPETLRGIHLQREPSRDAKYVRCVTGRIFDVAVDLRRDSSRFGDWVSRELTAESGNGLYIPAGFGHGYLTLEPGSTILYWTDQRFAPDSATGVRHDDPDLAIDWPSRPSVISDQDRTWPLLAERSDL